jgi:hypothetical protein
MTYAFTPGLRVTRSAVVRKNRLLPLKGEVLVKQGDSVRAEQVVARTDLPGDADTVNVIGRLGIEREDILHYMLKKEGDHVSAGEAIAETKPFIKWFKTKCTSPVEGIVEKISEVTGQVLIRQKPRPVELRAYIDGKVVEVIENEGVVVETHCAFIQGIFGVGREQAGEILVAVDSAEDILDGARVPADCTGKILVGGALVTREAIEAANRKGAVGIVVGGMQAKTLSEILGYDLGVAITGSEDIPTTIVCTEGFGQIGMAGRSFDLLKELNGRRASISGATQIRAGVIRPEVIVPTSAEEREAAKEHEPSALAIGDLVRIIREPYFGRIGKVTSLPPELTKVESETKVRILEMAFPDGQKAMLPRANIELIED